MFEGPEKMEVMSNNTRKHDFEATPEKSSKL